jgi:hypothetical protein
VQTTIFAKREVHCPFSATIEMTVRFHERGTEHWFGPFPLLRTRVACEIAEIRDYTDETRIHEALRLQWTAPNWTLLPPIESLITVRPRGPVTEMRMQGKYHVPLGWVGRILDRIIVKRLAQLTIERFLDELRDFVEQQWANERRAVSSHLTGGVSQ